MQSSEDVGQPLVVSGRAPDNGHISVHLEATGTHIVIGVADDGIGTSAQQLPDVFKLFVQAKRTLDRSQRGLGMGMGMGMGMGLTIVESLIKLHCGSVSAQSQGVGKGSEFTVRLPRLSEKLDGPLHAEKPPQPRPFIPSAVLAPTENWVVKTQSAPTPQRCRS